MAPREISPNCWTCTADHCCFAKDENISAGNLPRSSLRLLLYRPRGRSGIQFVERGYGLSHNCYARWLSNASYGTHFSTEHEMLHAARKNLATFTLVGITEWFDMSARRICERYQLTQGRLSAVNRNDATPHGNDVSAEESRVIIRHNELDRLIYEEAREQFLNGSARSGLDRAGTDTLERMAHT